MVDWFARRHDEKLRITYNHRASDGILREKAMMCFHKHKITNGQFVVDATTLTFLSYYIKIVTKELIYSENWHVHKDCYKTLLSIVFSVGALNSAPTEQDATSSATA
jgi:hypothetical protein